MKKVLLPILGMLLLLPAAAKSQTIRGVVVEDGTSTPIAGALVELMAPDESSVATAQSNSTGAFLLRPRRSGSFILRLRHLGYATVVSDTLVLKPEEAVEVEVRMDRTAIPLEPLVVTARRNARLAGFYERQQRSGIGRYVTRAELERRPGARATELLRMMPGVSLVPVTLGSGSPTGNLITMRGGAGRCMPTIYLDGVVVKQYADSPVDDFLKADMLEGIEVYTAFTSAPSPIHALDGCGVVAFWTRPVIPGTWSWKKAAAGAVGFVLIIGLTRSLTR
jgi:hypothetical protein